MDNTQQKKARVIAFYLPQFHPIPENDEWYGKGFTEWTNVGRAKPLFKGHYQPRVPADLGYYDLRVPEVREAQAEMAREYGVEGFCYWHYWFGEGKQLLERPFNEVLSSGKPDFPFCLAWANHSWEKKTWEPGAKNQMLIEQTYPGDEDYIAHFYSILPALKDHRYITVNGKPMFVVYAPFNLPDAKHFIKLWNKLALENGLKEFYFVAQAAIRDRDRVINMGFNAIYTINLTIIEELGFIKKCVRFFTKRVLGFTAPYAYKTAMDYYIEGFTKGISNQTLPSIIPNWDHSPRSGRKGFILVDSTPNLFKKYLSQITDLIKTRPQEERIVFLRSWNEWGEGNYIEPDLKYGTKYLEAMKEVIYE